MTVGRRVVRRVSVAAAVFAVALAACGGGADGEGGRSEGATVRLRAERPMSESVAANVERILGQRLAALGAHGTVTAKGDRVVVRLTDGDPDLVELAARQGGALEFRPVLDVLPPGAALTEEPAPDAEATLGGYDGEKYRVGPSMLDESVIDSAEAFVGDEGSWYVLVHFTADGAELFDEVAAQVLNNRLAIVVDRLVVSAPTIQTADFDGEASITGQFTEDESKALAAALSSGSLPVDLEVEPASDD